MTKQLQLPLGKRFGNGKTEADIAFFIGFQVGEEKGGFVEVFANLYASKVTFFRVFKGYFI